MKKLWKLFFVASIIIVSFMPVTTAEVRNYEGVGEYVMSDFETKDAAKQRAKERAERNAVEKAGVFVKSYTKTINAIVTDDEIEVIAGGVINILETIYKTELVDDAGNFQLVRANIKAEIDTDSINEWLGRDVREKARLVEENKELQRSRMEQDKKIDDLQKQLAAAKSAGEKAKLQSEITEADNALKAWQGEYPYPWKL